MENIKILGFQGVTLLDYPDKVASTVFLGGCNFNCPFCHNPEIVLLKGDEIPEERIFLELKERKDFIEGICITGGEPLLNAEIINFIKRLKKETDKQIKLDTNGYNTELLKQVLDLKVVDYVAMDIKSSLKKYFIAAGTSINEDNIKDSVDAIMKSGIDYEFRTTVVPEIIQSADIREIGFIVSGAKKMALQQFKSQKTLNSDFQKLNPYKPEEIRKFKDILSQFVQQVDIRGI